MIAWVKCDTIVLPRRASSGTTVIGKGAVMELSFYHPIGWFLSGATTGKKTLVPAGRPAVIALRTQYKVDFVTLWFEPQNVSS